MKTGTRLDLVRQGRRHLWQALSLGLCLMIMAFSLGGCQLVRPWGSPEALEEGSGGDAMSFRLESPAFEDGGTIPAVYTCDGQDISPPLRWSDPPEGTRSFALICDDPDAPVGTWVHWVMYNIPPDQRALAEGVPTVGILPDGARQGRNSWPHRLGYGGPCPPSGTHRYVFKLYALDTLLDLEPEQADTRALGEAMQGHILAQAQLIGLYQRTR